MRALNYYELIKEIEWVARQHPLIEGVYRQRYGIDENDTCYPSLTITTDNIVVGESETTVYLNLLYADRLTETQGNGLAVESVAIDVLTEIVNVLRESTDFISTDDDLNIVLLSNRYADNVAGAYVNSLAVKFRSNLSRCDWMDYKQRCDERT